ncbi:MAG: aldo/keto reductase [Acidobacteria bacterium]|nr:aldo/keto reductase [Acidobacteriota bacterium]MCI0620859.1 aldo/keto reductase [Acidobacteriota bacterium]MCI0722541.1 aldo/keto reductase [Acidobacteriota bacterium]
MNISRRQFLEAAAMGCATTVGGAAGRSFGASSKFPTRTLGRTKQTVSVLAFGSGSRFMMYEVEDKALEALNQAIDLGITYVDTAHSYGGGKSEERIGKVMARRRKEVVLATKLGARKADDALRQLELSLKRLQTDHVDVLHIHALSSPEDLAAIEAPDGVLKAMYKARDQKMARFIGITCHAAPLALQTALERHDFDCTQMALNAALARMAEAPGGMKATPMKEGGFEALALPVAKRKNLGVIAMKAFGQEQILGTAPIEKLLYYSMSLPVSTVSVGMPKLEHIKQNIELARKFKPLSEAERRQLSTSIAQEHKAAMERFFQDHQDA